MRQATRNSRTPLWEVIVLYNAQNNSLSLQNMLIFSKMIKCAVYFGATFIATFYSPARADIVSDHRKLMVAAIAANDAERIKKLLNTIYINVDDDLSQGKTWVSLAAGGCRKIAVQTLLDAGAIVNLGKYPPALFGIPLDVGAATDCDETFDKVANAVRQAGSRTLSDYVLSQAIGCCNTLLTKRILIAGKHGAVVGARDPEAKAPSDPRWTSLHYLARSAITSKQFEQQDIERFFLLHLCSLMTKMDARLGIKVSFLTSEYEIAAV